MLKPIVDFGSMLIGAPGAEINIQVYLLKIYEQSRKFSLTQGNYLVI